MNEALTPPPLKEQWETVQQILSQDLEPDRDGGGMRIRRGIHLNALAALFVQVLKLCEKRGW